MARLPLPPMRPTTTLRVDGCVDERRRTGGAMRAARRRLPENGRKTIVHGRRRVWPPAGLIVSEPFTSASAGRFAARAVSCTTADPPGSRSSVAGWTATSRELDASDRLSGRDDTLRIAILWFWCHLRPRHGPKPTVVAEAVTSAATAAPGSARPAAVAVGAAASGWP